MSDILKEVARRFMQATPAQRQILGRAGFTAASAVFVYFHFFRAGDGAQCTEVRNQKKTVILAQMSQILKWNDKTEETKGKEEEEEEGKKPRAHRGTTSWD